MAKIKNKKKSNMADAFAKKRKQQMKKTLTPFEVHVNRDKRKVLGQKSKADRGLPGVARMKAMVKRKGTLLQEYKLKDKDNIFLDKRIGEKNSSMSQEEKALARFAKERMKAHNKKNIFNLNDEEILTHRGQALVDIEKFDDPKSEDDEFSDEENRGGKLNKKFVEEAHFGGGLLSKPNAEMSRKDLIDQLIADSKKRKAERQKLHEQTQDLTDKLDSEWKDLLPIVTSSNKTSEKQVEKLKVDDYDIAVRELKFEARGNPSDKLKSEEKLAEEEKEKIETLEKQQLERMKGFSEENDRYNKHRSADDLEEGFQIEKIDSELHDEDDTESKDPFQHGQEPGDNSSEPEGDSEGLDEEDDEDDDEEKESKLSEDSNNEMQREDESESEHEDDNLSDLKGSESSSEDDEPSNKNDKTTEFKQIVQKQKHRSKIEERKRKNSLKEDNIMEIARAELPTTFTLPESYGELNELLQNHNEYYQSVIVERIIKSNHWSMGKGNKEKLAALFEHILMYIGTLDVTSAENVVKSFQIMDRLCPHLYDLAHLNPENAKKCIQEIIRAKHNMFEENKKKYVGVNLLIFLKLVSVIFPTSDFRHAVVTPCLVFMSQILFRCSVKKKSDISRGLYLSTLMLEYSLLSKRFAPSAINFLRGMIYIALPKPLKDSSIKAIPPFKHHGEFSNLLVLDECLKHSEIDVDKVFMKATDLVDGEIDPDFKLRVFVTTVKLISEFKQQYEELDSAFAIFEPFLRMFNCNFMNQYPKVLKQKVKELRKEFEFLKAKKLEYIVREKKKPKALRLYEPRIEKVYEGKRHKPMSKEKAEKEKMLHKLKREMKGAIREVRRDTTFLAKVKIKEQIKSDTERKRKVKEIFGEAAVQQGELNKIKRKKK